MDNKSKPLITKEQKNPIKIISDPSELKSFVNSLIFRIDGKYYDLSNFVDSHPGGSNILYYTKMNTWDATQLFSIHHVNYLRANSIINRFLITDIKILNKIHELEQIEIPKYFPSQIPHHTSKYYPFKDKPVATDAVTSNKWTFNDLKMADCTFELPKKGSFYWDLREEISKYFKKNNISYHPSTFYMLLFWIVVVLMICLQLSQYWFRGSYIISVLVAFCYGFIGGYGHQFIHIPQYRSLGYIGLDWIGLYSYSYMCDHVILHHIYTNTIPDNHFHGTDPFIIVNPLTPRSWFRKTFNFGITIITVGFGIYGNYILKLILIIQQKEKLYPCFFLFPLNYLLNCYLCGDIFKGIICSFISTFLCSSWYFTVALMNHNQSENWNMNKLTKSSKSNSWAKMQLITSTDIGYNYGFFGSMLFLWLNYHTVHHLLPTVDMSHHREAQKILNKVSIKHGISYTYKSPWTMYWEMLETFSIARAIHVIRG